MIMRRKFSREFKLEAVKLMNERGASEAAESLRIGMNLLYRWRHSFEKEGVEAVGKANFSPASAEEELRALRHRVRELEEEKEILKKKRQRTLPSTLGEVRIY